MNLGTTPTTEIGVKLDIMLGPSFGIGVAAATGYSLDFKLQLKTRKERKRQSQAHL